MPGTDAHPHARRAWLVAGACALLALSATIAAAQYALDFNTRVNMGVGANRYHTGSFGRRNTYRPTSYTYRTRSPYTVNRNLGTYTYNPNAAFHRSYYRPTGYNYSGGSYAYHRRVRTR
ncbi:MAG: hypothetical protein ACIAS6_12875 [Phycisphaerales bacterium JB060]